MQEKRNWASVIRLPSFSSPKQEREHSATLGDATATLRTSFHSDDGERLGRRASTESSRDQCEQQSECLGGGSEGISSLYTSVPRAEKRYSTLATDAGFDLDHVYNNWPSA